MDALYVLGTGSLFQNQEIKYSLRSLERFGRDIDRVIIIGAKPDFLDYDKVIHHPFKETGVKDYAIAQKILFACDQDIVSGNFLFMNDDFFFTKPFTASQFPYYQKGQLLIGSPKNGYQIQLEQTRDYLLANGKKTIHFDVHTPIVYNSERFQSLRSVWDYSNKTHGLVVKSIYCNFFGITGFAYNDIKLKELRNELSFKRIESSPVFSISDCAWNNGVSDFLANKFSEKSKYEL